jgi:GT2 family glycosyltransferase
VLENLAQNISINHEVIVVCNGNDPELVAFVEGHPGIHKYCLNSVNVGVSRAWNMGAMLAEGQHLCFLNDDVEVGKGGMERLVEVLESEDNIGEVGPAGGKWEGVSSGPRVGKDKVEEADEISGFCFVIKGSIFRNVGGFDISYTPAGFEEIDMSFMIRKKGYRCLVVPNIPITHYGKHGVSAMSVDIEYLNKKINTKELHERNKEIFRKKWCL